MNLTKEPNMLYSVINMKLSDVYPDLASLCTGLDIDEPTLVQTLSDAGFHYDQATNRFI